MKLRGLCLAVCCAAVSVWAAQARLNYRDEQFELRGFDVFNAAIEGGTIKFSGTGNPVEVFAKKAGALMSGIRAEGTMTRTTEGVSFLSEANLSGNAKVRIEDPLEGATTLVSEAIAYAGAAAEGTITFPQAATLSFQSSAADPSTAKQTAELVGSSGQLLLLLNQPAGINPVKRGEIAGPVRFTMRRDVPAGGLNAGVTTLDGTAASLKFDLSESSRTVELTGPVELSGASPAFTGDIRADRVLVTLDANLSIVRLDITGNPAQTRVRQPNP